MTRFIDARIPVAFGAEPGPGDMIIQSSADWTVVHVAGCACCVAREPAALALDQLFLDRVRGTVPWFDRVLVLGDGEAVRRAVLEDAVAGSRFRLG